MKQNEEFTVKIKKLSNLGTGIAKIDGQVIFVENELMLLGMTKLKMSHSI